MNDEGEVQVECHWLILIPSDRSTVVIDIETKYDEILRDPTTGHETLTGRSVPVSPSLRISFNLLTSNSHDIRSYLRTLLVNYHNVLSDNLPLVIFKEARDLGFGYNGFNLIVSATITYRTLVLPDDEGSLKAKILRMVLLGIKKEKESKSLKMETESCSICLEDFSGSNPTRMTCSHVFHAPCLVEWLYRKNSCPLCRTVLYDR